MLPRVTVERALDISRGLRPRNSPIFPSTCTMYLAARKHRQVRLEPAEVACRSKIGDSLWGRGWREVGISEGMDAQILYP